MLKYINIKNNKIILRWTHQKMLYYILIENSDGIDQSEAQDIVHSTKLLSKQCILCRFFSYITKNFKYEKYVRDGCYHCRIYENENKNLIFRLATIKKGTYRTVSNYFFKDVEYISGLQR